MSDSVIRHDNGTISVKIVIPWVQINESYNKHVSQALKKTEVPGFRKGRAPKNVAGEKLDKSHLMSLALSELLPPVYSQLIKANNLKPILYPQIQIDKGVSGQDFEFTATTCEAPVVTLPDNFRDEISKLKPSDTGPKFDPIARYLHQNCRVNVPDLLINEEVNHRLSLLVENLTKLGLDIPRYLQTKKLSLQDLKDLTFKESRADLEMELILTEVKLKEKLPDKTKTVDYLLHLLSNG
jgi:trigger factor